MFKGSMEYAGTDKFASPKIGHIFLKDTDLVNFDTIRNVSRQIGDETDETQGILCFGDVQRSATPHCGNKIFMRGDTTKKLMNPDYSVPNYISSHAEEITGARRIRAGITALVANYRPDKSRAIVTLPYMEWDYAHFREQFHEWAMDLKPPNTMTYELPDLYLRDRPITDPWTVGLLEAPLCTESYSVMSLIKTARQNGLIRSFIRMYHKIQAKFAPPNEHPLYHKMHVPVRFILGTGDSNENPELTRMIEEEIKEHSDIIVGDFIDSYENLPLKTLTGKLTESLCCTRGQFVTSLGYEYIKNVCSGPNKPEYFMFHDDDTMIQFPELVDYIKTEVNSIPIIITYVTVRINVLFRPEACRASRLKAHMPVLIAGESTTSQLSSGLLATGFQSFALVLVI